MPYRLWYLKNQPGQPTMPTKQKVMSELKMVSKDKVPVGQKAAFGAGHFILNILPGTLGVFIQFFLLTAWGVDPLWAGLLGGLPRIFDAITDPIMGFISDNTKSKYGRRRPYIFWGAIISGVLFFLMWQLDDNASQTYIIWHVMVLQILFLVGNTMFATPLVGLGYEMTSDYNERTRLMSFANSMGQIAWMIVPWLYVIIPDSNTFNTQTEGVRTMALIVGAMCILFGVLPALVCKGIDSAHMENRKKITFIIVFYMYSGSYEMAGTWPAWFNTINAMITAFLVIPIISKMSDKWGKKNAFIISTALSIVGYLLKWWGFNKDLNSKFSETSFGQSLNSAVGSLFEYLNPILDDVGMSWFSIEPGSNIPWLIFVPIPLFAFGMGGLFTLMMSMTADVCDLDELENGMPRKEGTFGAIYWWMVKLGQAIALVLGGVILKIVGFDPNVTEQTLDTMTRLRIADITIPSLTAALAIWVMWKYSLSEKRAQEIKEQLVKRRGEL